MSESFSSDSVLCDASSLISLVDSGFTDLLYEMPKWLKGSLLIAPVVRYEAIEHPLKIKQHALAALRMLQAERDGVIELVERDVHDATNDIMWSANNLFSIRNKRLKLVHKGEAELLAVANAFGIRNMLIDERTTRMIIEAPYELKKHLEREFERDITLHGREHDRLADAFGRMSFFRSSEVIAMAFEKGFFKRYGELETKALEASLYAVKFNGCGISFQEIKDYLEGVQ